MSEKDNNDAMGTVTREEMDNLKKEIRIFSAAGVLFAVAICALAYGSWNTTKAISSVAQSSTQLADSVTQILERDAIQSKLKNEYESWAMTDEGVAWLRDHAENLVPDAVITDSVMDNVAADVIDGAKITADKAKDEVLENTPGELDMMSKHVKDKAEERGANGNAAVLETEAD